MTAYDVARRLPAVADLRDLCRSLAMLDAILSPEWEDRYHSFNAQWAEGTALASMRDGSGDEYSIAFSAAGVCVHGFAHESPMSPYHRDGEPWPGVVDDVPAALKPFVEEPAFTDEDGVPVVTACVWREAEDDRWHHGTIDFPANHADPDGATCLFHLLGGGSPEAFRNFAEDYDEVPVDLERVSAVYALRPLSQEPVSSLNAELTMEDLARAAGDGARRLRRPRRGRSERHPGRTGSASRRPAHRGSRCRAGRRGAGRSRPRGGDRGVRTCRTSTGRPAGAEAREAAAAEAVAVTLAPLLMWV